MLLEMLNYCGSKDAGTAPKHPETTPSPPALPCGLHASLNIRGIATLLITEALDQEVPSLEAFFQSPLIPPRLPSTYLRVLLENVTGSLDLSGAPGNQADSAHTSPITSNILLSNLSVFMYYTSGTVDKDTAQVSLPLLITDQRLHDQYIVNHCRPSFSSTTVPAQPLSEVTLPTFEVVDWTALKLAGGSSKLSTWRVKSSTGKDQPVHSPPSKASAFPTSPKPPTAALLSEEELEELSLSSAITFTARVTPATTRSRSLTDILVRIVPLHVFFDVDIMLEGGGMIKFLDEVLAVEGYPTRDASDTFQGRSSLDDTEEEDSASDDELDTPFITPKQLERERERKRLERLVLEDLDLDIDYRTGAPARQRPHSKRVTNAKLKVDESVVGHISNLSCHLLAA
jgi:autophagy-related protein 2